MQCSVKLKFYETSESLQESICDWVPFKLNSKPSYLQLYFKRHRHRCISVNLQLYFKRHRHRCISVNVLTWKHFFIAYFHASMPSQTFYKIDVLEISSKFTGKRLYQTLFWYQFKLLTVLRRFCFRTDQYLFKILSYFRVYQSSSPSPPGPPYFFYIE